MGAVPGTRIFLLGRFGVEVEGRAIPASSWRRRRPIEVLTAIALAPGHVLHREELIDRLPEVTDSSRCTAVTRSSLRSARRLDARIVEGRGAEVRFRHALTRQALRDTLTHARLMAGAATLSF